MVRATIGTRTKVVIFYVERIKQAGDICTIYDISRRTLTRWVKAYKSYGTQGLAPKKPGPEHSKQLIPGKLEHKIVILKQKHPSLGARRIKHQYNLPCHWRTVHRVIKRHQGIRACLDARRECCMKNVGRGNVESPAIEPIY